MDCEYEGQLLSSLVCQIKQSHFQPISDASLWSQLLQHQRFKQAETQNIKLSFANAKNVKTVKQKANQEVECLRSNRLTS